MRWGQRWRRSGGIDCQGDGNGDGDGNDNGNDNGNGNGNGVIEVIGEG